MLLSASTPETTLIKLPAVVVMVAPQKPVHAQTAPATKTFSIVPHNAAVALAKTVQLSSSGVAGAVTAIPTVVNVVPSQTPSISLKFTSNGVVSSSSPLLVSTPFSSTMASAQGPIPLQTGGADQDPEESELTAQGMQQLPALPRMDEVEVSGTLQPAQSWMTFRIPVGSATQFLKVTLSQLGRQGESAMPALDQLYLVGPSGVVLTMLTGASAYAQGPHQGMMIFLTSVPDNSELLVTIVETATPSLPASPSQTLPASWNIPFSMDVQRTDMAAVACH